MGALGGGAVGFALGAPLIALGIHTQDQNLTLGAMAAAGVLAGLDAAAGSQWNDSASSTASSWPRWSWTPTTASWSRGGSRDPSALRRDADLVGWHEACGQMRDDRSSSYAPRGDMMTSVDVPTPFEE